MGNVIALRPRTGWTQPDLVPVAMATPALPRRRRAREPAFAVPANARPLVRRLCRALELIARVAEQLFDRCHELPGGGTEAAATCLAAERAFVVGWRGLLGVTDLRPWRRDPGAVSVSPAYSLRRVRDYLTLPGVFTFADLSTERRWELAFVLGNAVSELDAVDAQLPADPHAKRVRAPRPLRP